MVGEYVALSETACNHSITHLAALGEHHVPDAREVPSLRIKIAACSKDRRPLHDAGVGFLFNDLLSDQ